MTPVVGVECALPKDFQPYGRDSRQLRWFYLIPAFIQTTLRGVKREASDGDERNQAIATRI